MGVILGAFGAHLLKDRVPPEQLQNWEVGVRYQMYHALALIAVGLLADRAPYGLLAIASVCFRGGVAIFSGCLYAYGATGIKTFGMIVPIGGVLLIAGWGLLAAAVLKAPVESQKE